MSSLTIGYLIATGGFRRLDTTEWDPSFGLVMLFFLFPFWAPVLFVTMSRLLKAKIPKEIEIDSNSRKIRIWYSKRKVDEFDLEQLGYSKVGKFNGYICLTLYKTFIGSRGQLVTKKLTDLVGLKRTLSWKKYQVFEIIAELEKNEVLELLPENPDLPLWERLI